MEGTGGRPEGRVRALGGGLGEERGKRLGRHRSEQVERVFAHQFETGRLRRIFYRRHLNVRKRLLVQVCGFNLGLLMCHLTDVGTPRRAGSHCGVDCSANDPLERFERPPEALLDVFWA